MKQSSCYYFSFTDPGVTYQLGNRLFNFQIEPHRDHVVCDLSVHIVELGANLGGGRNLAKIRVPDLGRCRFRIPISDGTFDVVHMMLFVESDVFQAFARGPADYLAGEVNPGSFGMMCD